VFDSFSSPLCVALPPDNAGAVGSLALAGVGLLFGDSLFLLFAALAFLALSEEPQIGAGMRSAHRGEDGWIDHTWQGPQRFAVASG
jgi:hypothetical protein